jgi:hypothetical protein
LVSVIKLHLAYVYQAKRQIWAGLVEQFRLMPNAAAHIYDFGVKREVCPFFQAPNVLSFRIGKPMDLENTVPRPN